jgi:hypothetical protein
VDRDVEVLDLSRKTTRRRTTDFRSTTTLDNISFRFPGALQTSVSGIPEDPACVVDLRRGHSYGDWTPPPLHRQLFNGLSPPTYFHSPDGATSSFSAAAAAAAAAAASSYRTYVDALTYHRLVTCPAGDATDGRMPLFFNSGFGCVGGSVGGGGGGGLSALMSFSGLDHLAPAAAGFNGTEPLELTTKRCRKS